MEIVTDNSKVNAALIEENERLRRALRAIANCTAFDVYDSASCTQEVYNEGLMLVLIAEAAIPEDEEAYKSNDSLGALSVQNGAITLDVAKVAASPQGRAVLEKIRQIEAE